MFYFSTFQFGLGPLLYLNRYHHIIFAKLSSYVWMNLKTFFHMTQSLVITNILLGWLKDTAREAKHIMSSCKSLPRRNLNVTLSEVLKAFHVEIPHLTEYSNWILQKFDWNLLKTLIKCKTVPCISNLFHNIKFLGDFQEKSEIFNPFLGFID